MGVQIEGATVQPAAESFEIMAQNAISFRVWMACETQWRVAAGMGGIVWLGLDYGAVDVVLRRSAVVEADEVFADLMEMEAEALGVFGKVER